MGVSAFGKRPPFAFRLACRNGMRSEEDAGRLSIVSAHVQERDTTLPVADVIARIDTNVKKVFYCGGKAAQKRSRARQLDQSGFHLYPGIL